MYDSFSGVSLNNDIFRIWVPASQLAQKEGRSEESQIACQGQRRIAAFSVVDSERCDRPPVLLGLFRACDWCRFAGAVPLALGPVAAWHIGK